MTLCRIIFSFTGEDQVKPFLYTLTFILALIIFLVLLRPFLDRKFRKKYGEPKKRKSFKSLREFLNADMADTMKGFGENTGRRGRKAVVYFGGFVLAFLVSIMFCTMVVGSLSATVVEIPPDMEAKVNRVLTFRNKSGISERGSYVVNRSQQPMIIGCADRASLLADSLLSRTAQIPAGETQRVNGVPDYLSLTEEDFKSDMNLVARKAARGEKVWMLMPASVFTRLKGDDSHLRESERFPAQGTEDEGDMIQEGADSSIVR